MHPVLSVVPTSSCSSTATPAIATGFVRKLYRILDQNHADAISWDPSGLSFSIHDEAQLEEHVLPQYFRGRLDAFHQQLKDHGFAQSMRKSSDARNSAPITEGYHHPHFARGCPEQLSRIIHVPTPRRRLRTRRIKATGTNAMAKRKTTSQSTIVPSNPLFLDDLDLSVWLAVSAMPIVDNSPRGVDVFTSTASQSRYPDTDCEEMKAEPMFDNEMASVSPQVVVMNTKEEEKYEAFSTLSVDCSVGVGFDGSSPFSDDTIYWMMASWDLTGDST